MMILLALITVMVCVAMPLGYAWRVARLDAPARGAWMAVVAEASVIVGLILILGRWDVAGHYTRYAVAGLFAAAIVVSWRRNAHRRRRGPGAPAPWRGNASTLVSLTAFTGALVYVAFGALPVSDSRRLTFPLEGGVFMVAHGGGNFLLNRHAGHRAQRHAVDITAINAAGFRAAGLLPAEPERYEIFGASVVAPCAGRVVRARDGLPDLSPPERDAANPAGNHAVIACDGLLVELAHLRDGSVAVAAGDTVAAGHRIGEVGNSGNTTEPHLHIHAVGAADGAAVAIAFDGVAPLRGRTFTR